MSSNEKKDKLEKVLLAHLPFWDPLVPPMGIAAIKSFIAKHGYKVKTCDLNVEKKLNQLYNSYFDVFSKYIPEDKRGNFFNIGHDVMHNHMMAHINYTDEEEYLELVKILIDTIFFNDASREQVLEHTAVVREIYRELEDYFLDLFEKEQPDVLGLTVYKATLPAALFVFQLAKEKVPGIKTVMGGGIFADTMTPDSPNMNLFLEKTRNTVDKIMIGKGERFFLKFLRNQLPPSQRVFTMKDLEDENIEPFASDIPDLSDLDPGKYPYLVASGSKSCPYKCTFCNSSLFYGEYLKRPAEQSAAQMTELYETYGCRMFFMSDALLNPTISELSDQLIEAGHALYFDGYFRVDEETTSRDNTLHWRQGGFYRARLGVESGSQRILDLMDKQITVEQTRESLAALAYAGIKPTSYIVIGHPGETEEDFQATLDLMTDIRNHVWQAECVPFAYYFNGQPGSDKWENKRAPLYPESADHMLVMRSWYVNVEPSRQEIYNRVFRFSQHCKKLGIPNPYSLKEIYEADQRWKRLHKNAVPPLVELMSPGTKPKTQDNIKKLHFAESKRRDEDEFGF
ncbi:MAG: radical SAM protein [bacterium]|nr:radical SAM protein [bacterium]